MGWGWRKTSHRLRESPKKGLGERITPILKEGTKMGASDTRISPSPFEPSMCFFWRMMSSGIFASPAPSHPQNPHVFGSTGGGGCRGGRPCVSHRCLSACPHPPAFPVRACGRLPVLHHAGAGPAPRRVARRVRRGDEGDGDHPPDRADRDQVPAAPNAPTALRQARTHPRGWSTPPPISWRWVSPLPLCPVPPGQESPSFFLGAASFPFPA